jgi:hypothetical protein
MQFFVCKKTFDIIFDLLQERYMSESDWKYLLSILQKKMNLLTDDSPVRAYYSLLMTGVYKNIVLKKKIMLYQILKSKECTCTIHAFTI